MALTRSTRIFSVRSLKVKLGDKVRTGDILALLGNTGNSDAPHLHFHLMDGTSPLDANGLPYVFTRFSGRGVMRGGDEAAVFGKGEPAVIDASAACQASTSTSCRMNLQVVEFRLERNPAKWIPVRREIARQTKASSTRAGRSVQTRVFDVPQLVRVAHNIDAGDLAVLDLERGGLHEAVGLAREDAGQAVDDAIADDAARLLYPGTARALQKNGSVFSRPMIGTGMAGRLPPPSV